MLESMAFGTPVISFAVGGMPDVIENGVAGYVAPCFDTKAYSKYILDLVFDQEKRNHMSGNCRQLMEEKFQLHHQADRYLNLFEDLLRHYPDRDSKAPKASIPTTGNQIILETWKSEIAEEFYDIYRNAAVGVIKHRDAELSGFHNSKTFRILRILDSVKKGAFLQRFKKRDL